MTMRNRTSRGAWKARRGAGRRGFTFLELMIVITILLILISVTAARMKSSSQRAALLGSAREIVAACNVARQSAISTQRDVWLKFDVNQDRWRIDLNVNPDEEDPHANYDTGARYNLEATHTLPPKISFVGVTTQVMNPGDDSGEKYPLIVFHPDGTATEATVLLQSARGRKMTIQVSAATGRPEAYRGTPKKFQDKLKALGIDSSAFASEEEGASAYLDGGGALFNPGNRNNPDATPVPGSQPQHYYEGILDRLLQSRGFGQGNVPTETRYER